MKWYSKDSTIMVDVSKVVYFHYFTKKEKSSISKLAISFGAESRHLIEIMDEDADDLYKELIGLRPS